MGPLVSDLMETDVQTIGADETLERAGTRLYEAGVGSLLVESAVGGYCGGLCRLLLALVGRFRSLRCRCCFQAVTTLSLGEQLRERTGFSAAFGDGLESAKERAGVTVAVATRLGVDPRQSVGTNLPVECPPFDADGGDAGSDAGTGECVEEPFAGVRTQFRTGRVARLWCDAADRPRVDD